MTTNRTTLEENLNLMIAKYPEAKKSQIQRYGHEFIEAYLRNDFGLANMYAVLIGSVIKSSDHYGRTSQ